MEKNKKKYNGIDKTALLFLLPAMVIYISVIIFPVFYSLYIGFFQWNGIGEMNFVGISNYVELILNDAVFHKAIKNNAIWIVLTLTVTMITSFILAMILCNNFKGKTFFRGLFYLPCVIAPIAVAIIWRWIYNPNIGFVNEFFRLIGFEYSQNWISSPTASLYAVFAASVWQGVGQPMLLFIAGISAISTDVLEASVIDGAKGIKKLFYIIIPMLRETFVIVIATLLVASMKVYDIIQGLTGGGPGDATEMLSTYMYSQVFKYNNVGYGTAVACIMVLIMLIVIIPYVLFMAKED
ncbi:MAG: carbohydrate ABC transporter permease [Lachnospirales bacterium]